MLLKGFLLGDAYIILDDFRMSSKYGKKKKIKILLDTGEADNVGPFSRMQKNNPPFGGLDQLETNLYERPSALHSGTSCMLQFEPFHQLVRQRMAFLRHYQLATDKSQYCLP
jgi:hypothetical protein